VSAKKAVMLADRWKKPHLETETMILLSVVFLLLEYHVDPVVELRRILDNKAKCGLKAEARLAALLEAEDERRRERDEPGLTAKEKASRAARGTLNEAHRKALRRTLDELGWSVGHKKVSHSKRARQIARADAHKPQ